MMLLLLCCCLVTQAVGQYTFDDSNGLGRRFDGIGGLSGGGATSKLLPGYPENLRDQILDYLFKPNFGAALHILKVEIGGGSMSGVGSEASHIYYDGDENYQRGYEWWIMKEAKKRNPKIKLYGLPWVFSGWVGNGTKSPYTYPDRTVEYIIKWIKAAKTYYDLDIDYIGEWNEREYNVTYLKMLRQALDKNNLEQVQIVAADDFQAEFETNLARDMLLDPELSSAVNFFGHLIVTVMISALKAFNTIKEMSLNSKKKSVIFDPDTTLAGFYVTLTLTWVIVFGCSQMLRKSLDENELRHVKIVAADDFGADYASLQSNLVRDMDLDPELSSAVDYYGVHYSSTQSNLGSLMWGKQLWASEDYSSFNDEKGARCWARILNQNYVNGLMTSTISWNLIAAYYEGMPYQRCGLMTANSPWSGHYDVNPTIWMTAHTTQFTEPGWTYLSHHSGVGHLVGGGSYVALTSPDRKQLTIVIETIDFADSQCLHEALPQFTVVNQTVTFKLKGSFSSITELHTWFSMLGNSKQNNLTVLFEYRGIMKADESGLFTLDMEPNQIYTLSTMNTAVRGEYPDPPDPEPFPLPYMDNFDDVVEHQEPYFVAPMSGSFEVVTASGTNKVLRQMTVLPPVDWCETENFTLALIGNISWTNIYVETSFSLDVKNATEGVFVAQRINSGGCYTEGGQGFLFFVFPKNATYEFWGDSRRATLLGYGPAPSLKANGFNKLGLKVKDGFAEGYANGELVFGVRMPDKPASGFPAFGTAGFGHADFDYISINES